MKHLLSRLFLFSFVLMMGSFAFANPSIPEAQTPTDAIKELDKQADQYRVGKNLNAADIEFNRKLKENILHGTFDLRELAKLALDKYWNQRTAKEQDRFVALLTSLLEERSIFSKEKAAEKGNTKSYSINYSKDTYLNKNKTDAMVKTRIVLVKRNLKITLNYKLKRTATGWRIYDVIMDGASLVDNYRYSFSNIIDKHGYDDLVHRMEKKLNEFRGKRV
ncbi:MAG: ABC transporter substrate-binding protein [Deltaproteobacteria bacterium]|nr:ABC transporter substrate-binding protein [Deltaproteobacteria bacterium]